MMPCLIAGNRLTGSVRPRPKVVGYRRKAIIGVERRIVMCKSYPQGPKSTWQAQASAISAGEVTISESDIPMLLEWMQDMNWPGAETIAKFLVGFGSSLTSSVHKVLQSGDKVWINWVLLFFKDEFQSDIWLPLTKDLQLIASEQDEESAHIAALSILAKWKLAPIEELKHSLSVFKGSGILDPKEYSELERLLD